MVDARTLHALLPVAIVIGLAFSGYAAYETLYPAAQASCSVNGFFSCSKVDQSGLTSTFGIPDYAIGVAGFVALLALDVPLLLTYRRGWLYALFGLSTIGLVFSIYLAYVELAEIQALCLICTGAYLSNVVVWAIALGLVRESRSPGDSAASRTAEPA